VTHRWISRLALVCLTALTALPTLATSPIRYRVTDLGFLPASGSQPLNTLAEAINDSGQITGMASIGGDGYAMVWDAVTGLRAIDSLPLRVTPTPFERGLGINSLGQVVGTSAADGSAFVWDPVSGVRSVDGGPFPVAGAFNPNGLVSANDINTSGTIVGRAYSTAPAIWDPVSGTRPVFTGAIVGDSTAINDAGQVVGYSRSTPHGFFWQPGSAVISIAGLPNADGAIPRDVNMPGVVVGHARIGTASLAFIWDVVNGTRYIGDLRNAGSGSSAFALNDDGYVVGNSASPGGASSAFIWHASLGMQDLNLLVDAADPMSGTFHVFSALDINNSGQIVAQGLVDGDARQRSFLLTPVPEARTYVLMLVGLLSILAILRRRGHGADRRTLDV